MVRGRGAADGGGGDDALCEYGLVPSVLLFADNRGSHSAWCSPGAICMYVCACMVRVCVCVGVYIIYT